ncbi:unnamed protein product [Prorocentrum cordatum]|uniref:Nucleotide-diphospho-sugar transferase domain-containing protein n=1 Tax=Prorocentrum cordatum TaxID=2364126 RepID=A0ABN9VSA6_9DINO|nr:unnamed protein product [Polarella glacialis]
MKEQASAHGFDILMIMLRRHVHSTSRSVLEDLRAKGIQVVPVDWDLPPGTWVPVMRSGEIFHTGMQKGWCGPMDLMRLHIFGLASYDAVMYVDGDVELQGDVTPVLRCAATGRLLTTSGTMAPVNFAMIATRPDERMLRAAEIFARNSSFTRVDGWAGGGYRPSDSKYIGAECGQGFMHTLYYKATTNALAYWSLKEAGILPEDVKADQLDRCIWNYHGHEKCGVAGKTFDCSLVRVHHKPKDPTQGSCTKLRERGVGKRSQLTAPLCRLSPSVTPRECCSPPCDLRTLRRYVCLGTRRSPRRRGLLEREQV